MSFSYRGVEFSSRGGYKNKIAIVALRIGRKLVSFLFVLFLGCLIAFPPKKLSAASGISSFLSYQGRLTDTGGNPLGGAGTNYCFRFSIYDDTTVGAPDNKLWPAGAPSSMTVSVANGVFNVGVGDTGGGGDDLSTFDFSANNPAFLNVEVNQTPTTCGGSWDNLGPRQRLDAVAFARGAYNLYGGQARIGTGAGVASGQKLLYLDVKNAADTIGTSCTTSGTLWYNSANTRTLVCDNGLIQEVGNTGTIVGIKEASAGSAISSGTVQFSGVSGIGISQTGQTLSIYNKEAFGISNIGNTLGTSGTQTGTIVFSGQGNITLSQITGAGGVQTIGISAAGGGGGGASLKGWNIPYGVGMGSISNMGVISNGSLSIIPWRLAASLTVDNFRLLFSNSMGASTTNGFTLTVSYALYSRNVSTLSLMSTAGRTYGVAGNSSNSNSYNGLRGFDIDSVGNGTVQGNAWNLPPGDYWMGVYVKSTGSGSFSFMGVSFGSLYSGPFGSASNTSFNIGVIGPGVYSASTAAMPAAIPNTLLNNTLSGWRIPFIYIGDEPATL